MFILAQAHSISHKEKLGEQVLAGGLAFGASTGLRGSKISDCLFNRTMTT